MLVALCHGQCTGPCYCDHSEKGIICYSTTISQCLTGLTEPGSERARATLTVTAGWRLGEEAQGEDAEGGVKTQRQHCVSVQTSAMPVRVGRPKGIRGRLVGAIIC